MAWILANLRTIKLIGIALALACVFGGGYRVGAMSVHSQWDRAIIAAKKADEIAMAEIEANRAAAAAQYESETRKLRTDYRRINALLDHEMRTAPNNCAVGAVRVRAINQAVLSATIGKSDR